MVIEAKLAYPRRQRVAITLALTGQQGGVGGAHHHIEDIGRAPDNLGHGLDHRLDTFVRAHQPECQDHLAIGKPQPLLRSEEHTSELQSLMRISYAVFCLKTKNNNNQPKKSNSTTHNRTI